MPEAEVLTRVKEMLVESLMLQIRPADIGDDTPLFSPDGLALDSIDALELAVALEKRFGVKIPNAETARAVFQSARTIAEHIGGMGQSGDPQSQPL